MWGDPSWDPAALTRSPSARPTPEPTVNLGAPLVNDDFGAFDERTWLEPCAGCSYEGGSLRVAGDSQMIRTVGTVAGVSHLRGRLTKDSSCNDHFLGISLSPALPWEWGSTANTAKFMWNW